MTASLPKRFPGSKWLDEASYLTADERTKVREAVVRAREAFPGERISVRPPSYIGEPHPYATVCHGGFIFEQVYR